MLYHLLVPLAEYYIAFNLFRYQTFRAAGAVVTALLLAWYYGPAIIRRLRILKLGQVVREVGPKTHLGKAGTPTMGGVIIVFCTVVATLLWARWDVPYTWAALAVLVWMGALGFLDDYLKIVHRSSEGLRGRYKVLGQLVAGVALGTVLVLFPFSPDVPPTWTQVPFVKSLHVEFHPLAYIGFVTLVVVASSNAVNLTDGLDGLASGLSTIAAATFAVFAYLMGRVDSSDYLDLFYLPGAGELAIFCVALAGGCVGFLWYNAHPAEVFMGDTGSLAIGGALGAVAVLLKVEFLLVIVGGVFVAETASVAAQTLYFKWTKRRTGVGRRIFRMAPLHHHFEQIGWHENKVIIRFWILGLLCALLGFATLKIR